LAARHPRHEKSATVSGALIDSHELRRWHLLDVGKRQLRGSVQLPLDLHRELVGINIERHVGQMVAHEKCIVRRDNVLIKHRERRFQLRRAAGEPDHQTLLWIFDNGPLAVFERHCHRIRREASNRKPADHAASREQGCPTLQNCSAIHQHLSPYVRCSISRKFVRI
jgi:hypothetical protein